MKIAVLVSGGVDSAVSLRLLHAEGKYQLTAFYLKIWLEDELSFLGECPWEEDLSFVRQICAEVNIPLRIIPLQKEYHDAVVAYTISEALAGRTPNPDVLCNMRIKFGCFMDAIKDECFDKIASGHYATIKEGVDGVMLAAAIDPIKDQTYFLAGLHYDQLSKILFPIGHLYKHEVRQLACQYNLPNKARRDSQGICFLGKIKFKEFIKVHLGVKLGSFVEFETGTEVGIHEGYWFYTIGQRQGIGLSGGPWYVVAKDIAANKVYISRNYHQIELFRDSFYLKSIYWMPYFNPQTNMNLRVKIRHGAASYYSKVIYSDGVTKVYIGEPDQGIAAGQFAVFYDQDICVGAGFIDGWLEGN